MLSSLRNVRDNITRSVFSGFHYNADSFCQIESIVDDTTFVLNDGGLMTMLDVSGISAMPGEDDSRKIFESLNRTMAVAFKKGSHQISMSFERDPYSAKIDITEAYQPSFQTIKRLSLDLSDVLQSDINRLTDYCCRERCFMTIITYPDTLSKKELKSALESRQELMIEEGMPPIRDAQNPLKAIIDLIHVHRSLVNSIEQDSNDLGFIMNQINVDDAIFHIRRAVDEEFTDIKWRPQFPYPGTNQTQRTNSPKKNHLPPMGCIVSHPSNGDVSHLLPRIMGVQIVPRDIEIVGRNMRQIRVGNRFYAPLVFDAGPDKPEDFLSLFRRVGDVIPWRITMNITPNGIKAIQFKKIYTSIFGFMSDSNRRIRDAIRGLEGLAADGDPDVGLQMNAITWANDEKAVLKNQAAFARAIQGWGGCDVTDNIGDPVSGFFAVVPAFSRENPAKTMAAPLSSVVDMLPALRPASPWKDGAILYRTPDGKIYPVQPTSSLQDTWNVAIYAPPGSGKSVTMNSENLAFCVSAGLTQLPLLLILDIGPSSSGLISLLKDALPEERKHEAGYFKIQNRPECAINIFATQLGCRFPTPKERSTQVNFITLLATPIGSSTSYNMAGDLAGLMIDEMYKNFSDLQRPKIYQKHMELAVDEALKLTTFEVTDNTSWWEVVDVLFLAGNQHQASRAQEYALPVLSDLMSILNIQSVKDMYNRDDGSAVAAGNGQTLVNAFATVISSALREYPVLNGVTKFDVGDVRVLSLDLNDVTQGDDPASKRRAAIFYFLGYAFASRNFFVDEVLLKIAPPIYHAYHKKRAATIKEDKKAIVMDEFHKTGRLQALRSEIVTNMREGRKWNVRVVLASQLLEDFDEEMIKLLTTVYVMRAPNQVDIEKAQHMFNLSSVAAARMDRELTGPRVHGVNFLAIYITKKGRFAQILTNTIGPVKRWALTTTSEEMSLRSRMYELLGGKRSRDILVKAFPDGTAMPEIERRRMGLDEGSHESVVDTLLKELLLMA